MHRFQSRPELFYRRDNYGDQRRETNIYVTYFQNITYPDYTTGPFYLTKPGASFHWWIGTEWIINSAISGCFYLRLRPGGATYLMDNRFDGKSYFLQLDIPSRVKLQTCGMICCSTRIQYRLFVKERKLIISTFAVPISGPLQKQIHNSIPYNCLG